MIELKKGDIVPLTDVKQGETSRGRYMLINVKAQKGYDKITVSVDNVDEARDFRGRAKIGDIIGVRKSAHEWPKGSGKWYDDYSVTAVLERLSEQDVYAGGFAEFTDVIDSVDDAELPFN